MIIKPDMLTTDMLTSTKISANLTNRVCCSTSCKSEDHKETMFLLKTTTLLSQSCKTEIPQLSKSIDFEFKLLCT